MPAPASRHRLRFALKGIGLALLVLVGLVAIAGRAADTPWGRERIRQLLLAEINSGIRGTLSVESLEGSLYGRPVLRGVELRDPQGQTVVAVAAISLEYHLWELVSGELRIDRVRLLAPRINLALERTGQLNLAAALAPARPSPIGDLPSDLRLEIAALHVQGGRLSLAHGDGSPLQLDELSMATRIELRGQRARIELERVSGRWEQFDLPFALEAGLAIGPEDLSAESLELRVGKSRLEIASARLWPDSGRLQADLKLTMAPGELGRLMPGLNPAAGLQLGGHLENTPGLVSLRVALSGTLAGARVAFDVLLDPAGPAVQGKLKLIGLDPAAVYPGAPSGALDLSIEGALSRIVPAELAGRLQATASGQIAGLAFRSANLEASAASGLAHGSFQAKDLRLGVLSAPSVSGRFKLEGLSRSVRGEASLRAAQFNIGRHWSGPVSTRVATGSDGGRFQVSLEAGAPGAPLSLSTELVLLRQAGALEARLQRLRLGLGSTNWKGRQGNLHWQADMLEVREMVLLSPHGRLSLSGTLSHGAVRRLQLAAKGLDLAGLARSSGLTRLAGLRGKVDLELDAGTLAGRPRIAAQLIAAEVGWVSDGPNIDGRLRADLDGTRIKLSGRANSAALGTASLELTARAPARPLLPEAWAELNPTDLLTARLDLQQLDPAELAAGPAPLRGRLAGQVELDRQAGRARLDIQLTAGRISAWDLPVSASLEARLNGRQLNLDGRAQSEELGDLRLSAAARLPGAPENSATWRGLGLGDLEQARLTWSDLGLSAIEKRLPPEWTAIVPQMAGRASLQVELSDKDSQAGRARIGIQLTADKISAWDLPVSASLEARLNGRQLELDGQAQSDELGDLQLSAAARLPGAPDNPATWIGLGLGDLDRARLTWNDLGLSAIEKLPPEWTAILPKMAGRARLQVELSNKDRQATVELALERVLVADHQVPIDARLQLTADGAHTRGRLESSLSGLPLVQADFELALGLDALRGPKPPPLDLVAVSGRLEFKPLPLSLLAEAMRLPQATSGMLSSQAVLSGTFALPDLDLHTQLEQVEMAGVALGRLDGRIRLDRQALVLDLHARQPKGGDLDAELRLALSTDAELAGSLSANGLQVGPLAGLMRALGGPPVDFSGKLDAAVSLAGSRHRPRGQGWAQLSAGSLHLSLQQRILHEVTLGARLQGDWLELNLVGRAGGGRLCLALDADLGAGWPSTASATLSATDFPVVAGDMLFSVDLAAKLEASRQQSLWRVQADVLDGLLRLPQQRDLQLHDIELPLDVTVAGRSRPADAAQPAADSGGQPSVRLNVSIPETLRVRGEDLESKLRADLTISLIDAWTAIEGQAALVDGDLTLFDQRYDINRARTVFQGQIPPNPQLDVNLEHDFGEAVVFIHLQGTANKPKLFFSSNPPGFDQAQLLAMVLGHEMNPKRQESQEPVDIQNQALSAASGLLLSEMRSVLKKALPIDTLQIQTAPQAGTPSTEITVGKWITRDLFLAYRYRMGGSDDQNANEARLEYRLGRHWILEGAYGDSSQGGLDVLWIRRF